MRAVSPRRGSRGFALPIGAMTRTWWLFFRSRGGGAWGVRGPGSCWVSGGACTRLRSVTIFRPSARLSAQSRPYGVRDETFLDLADRRPVEPRPLVHLRQANAAPFPFGLQGGEQGGQFRVRRRGGKSCRANSRTVCSSERYSGVRCRAQDSLDRGPLRSVGFSVPVRLRMASTINCSSQF